ncbi:nucleoporin Nup146 [Schizosaccharomyces japonicus yFS275]|uniref:Nucleoporin Nup146 n=1 Tax=Schizosaccharomyces japonicus (strain yFS275 / FY16936) TaxID=402676 RepID=B6JX88_SCHJY|nr:nucleoporin Nup146 [Schizosaccharomyces japonicus yFS275]EEB05989.1 nucleoporin Nup146 [Schizosaccharomyces japonicus yFS275]
MDFQNPFSALSEPANGARNTEIELEEHETDQILFTGLQLGTTVSLFSGAVGDKITETAVLFAVNGTKKLFVAGGPSGLVLGPCVSLQSFLSNAERNSEKIEVNDISDVVKVDIPNASLTHVGYSASGDYVVVADKNSGVSVYSTSALMSKNVSPLWQDSSLNVSHLLPNPDFNEFTGIVTNDRSFYVLNANGWQLSEPIATNVSAACWSRRGKQIVLGLMDGSLHQYTPLGSKKAEFMKPDSLNNVYVESICWSDNRTFAVYYAPVATLNLDPSEDNVHESKLYIVKPSVTGAVEYGLAEDPCPPFGMTSRRSYHFFGSLKSWKPKLKSLIVVAGTGSADVGVMAYFQDSEQWQTLSITDETQRASLPYSSTTDSDTSPIGMCFDFSATDRIERPLGALADPESSPSMPILWVYNNECQLSGYRVLYKDAVLDGSSYEEMSGVEKPARTVEFTPSGANAFELSSSPANLSFASFGVKPNASSLSAVNTAPAFGTSTASPLPNLAKTSFMQPSPLAQSSTFGQTAVFGQTSFTQSPLTNISFSKETKPFASSSASKFGMFAAKTTAFEIPKDNEAQSLFSAPTTTSSVFSSKLAQPAPETKVVELDEDVESDVEEVSKVDILANDEKEPTITGNGVSFDGDKFAQNMNTAFTSVFDKSKNTKESEKPTGFFHSIPDSSKKPLAFSNAQNGVSSFVPPSSPFFAGFGSSTKPSAFGTQNDMSPPASPSPAPTFPKTAASSSAPLGLLSSTGNTAFSNVPASSDSKPAFTFSSPFANAVENKQEEIQSTASVPEDTVKVDKTEVFGTAAKTETKSGTSESLEKEESKTETKGMGESVSSKQNSTKATTEKASEEKPLFSFKLNEEKTSPFASAGASAFQSTFQNKNEPSVAASKSLFNFTKPGAEPAGSKPMFSFPSAATTNQAAPASSSSSVTTEQKSAFSFGSATASNQLTVNKPAASSVFSFGAKATENIFAKKADESGSTENSEDESAASDTEQLYEDEEKAENELPEEEADSTSASESEEQSETSEDEEAVESPAENQATILQEIISLPAVKSKSKPKPKLRKPVELLPLLSLQDADKQKSVSASGMASAFEDLYYQLNAEMEVLSKNIQTLHAYVTDQQSYISSANEPPSMTGLEKLQEKLEVLVGEAEESRIEKSKAEKEMAFIESSIVRINAKKVQVARLAKAHSDPSFQHMVQIRQLGPEALRKQLALRLKMEKTQTQLANLEKEMAAVRVHHPVDGRAPTTTSLMVAYCRLSALLAQREKELYLVEDQLKRIRKVLPSCRADQSTVLSSSFLSMPPSMISQVGESSPAALSPAEIKRQRNFRRYVHKKLFQMDVESSKPILE